MISEAEKQSLYVGFKQALRALNENTVSKVFLAQDCDKKISSQMEDAASKTDAQVFYVPTMKELGAMCGIEVGASCAAVLKN